MALPQVPRRRVGAAPSRRRTVVRVVVSVRGFVPSPRRQPRRILPSRRGRVVQVTLPGQPGPPIWRPQIVRRRVPFLPLRRGRTPSVPLTQTVAVVVASFVPQIQTSRRRDLLPRRGRVVSTSATFVFVPQIARPVRRHYIVRRGEITQTPIPPTVVVVTVGVPSILSRRRMAAWSRRRTQPTAPFTVAVAVPAIQGRRRGAVGLRKRLQPVTPVRITVTVPSPVQRRRAVPSLRRRSQVVVPPATVVVAVTGYVPSIVQRRRLWGFVPRRSNRVETIIAVVIPPVIVIPPPPPPLPVDKITLLDGNADFRSTAYQALRNNPLVQVRRMRPPRR